MIGETIQSLIEYSAIIILIVMVVSPTYFFRIFEKFLNDDTEEIVVRQYDPNSIMKPTVIDEVLNNQDRKLESLNKICNTNLNKEARRIWENKRNEYLRELRWRALGEQTIISEKKLR